MTVWIYSLASALIVSLVSLLGVITLALHDKRLKKSLIYLVSFSAGAFLGDVFIHLLPEAVEKNGFEPQISFYVLLGIIVSFCVEKIIHWHHFHNASLKQHYHPSSIMNLIGDGIHNFIDGLVIGISYLLSIPVGIASTIAVIFHEIPQEIGDFGVLIHGGFSKWQAVFFNFLTALTALLGVILALFLGSTVKGATDFLVPFAAGNFIYIAGSDLIPELHKEVSVKKSFGQFFFLVLGIVVMALLLYLE